MNMGEELWTTVDEYLSKGLLNADSVLDNALAASAAAGLPPIQVSPCQGRLLQLLAQLRGARRILEIGTLGGYSTIWLARALPPGGRLVTLELDERHAQVAQSNIAQAGFSQLVELHVGPALETLPELASRAPAPFDLVFIDADKSSTPEYFQWALKLSRRGSLIIVDNIVRKGGLVDEGSPDPAIQGMRRLIQTLSSESRVSATALQTVGVKGYDGFLIALVTA
jgi:predicted O-methyltransferase YrrM